MYPPIFSDDFFQHPDVVELLSTGKTEADWLLDAAHLPWEDLNIDWYSFCHSNYAGSVYSNVLFWLSYHTNTGTVLQSEVSIICKALNLTKEGEQKEQHVYFLTDRGLDLVTKIFTTAPPYSAFLFLKSHLDYLISPVFTDTLNWIIERVPEQNWTIILTNLSEHCGQSHALAARLKGKHE